MEEVTDWLQRSEGPLAYALIGGASGVEYLVPPLPGDTIALFGIALAATAGYSVLWVYLALNLGALCGGMSVYGIGRWIGVHRAERTPRFLRTQQARAAIDATLERFERHGALYLVLNRFVPALRAFFFLAAGIAGLPAWKVAVFGTLSAMIWNGLLLLLGWIAGSNFETLERWVSTYTYVAVAVTLVVVGVVVWRALRTKPAAPPP
ncbi:MAG: DedA family protein [Sandaracinaceae bacterium]|nr:DedA family protein [Sandaracinaceae bacterium]